MIKAVLFDLGDTLIRVNGTGETFPHAIEMLKGLRTRYKLGLICNATKATTRDVEEILQRAGIRDFFDIILVSTDVGYAKPQAQIFKIALDHLSAKPPETVMVATDWKQISSVPMPSESRPFYCSETKSTEVSLKNTLKDPISESDH